MIFTHFVVKPCRFELSGAVGEPRNPEIPLMDVLVEIRLRLVARKIEEIILGLSCQGGIYKNMMTRLMLEVV